MSTGKSLAMLPFFVRDYIAATRHFRLAERGAYTDLLFFQWENGRLPKEPERLARLIGCTPEEFDMIWPHIRDKFVEIGDGLFNARLEDHRSEAERLRDARVKSANQTNAKRSAHRDGQRNADRNADRPIQGTLSVTPSDTVTGTSPSPSPSESPNPSPKESDTSSGRACTMPGLVPRSFHDEVIAAYHELLPELPEVKVWSDTRRQALNARIRERCKESKPADTVKYWRDFFVKVGASDFLCRNTKSGWRPNLAWLIKAENFAKVIEGSFDTNRGRSNGAQAHG